MLNRTLARFFLLLTMLLAVGARAQEPSQTDTTAVTPVPEQYQIGPSDRLQINVWQHQDLSPAVIVLPDGEISLPLIGEVKAAGRTEKDLAAEIQRRLSEYVRNPEVTVSVISADSANFQQRIRVTGALMRPASVPFRKGMTVLDVVLEAGGPNEFASANKTKLYRTTASGTEVLKVYLDDILKKGKMDTNYPLQPSDVITVPERLF